MTSSPALIFQDDLSIPADVSDLDRFRRWTRDETFPERGRIDYLAGTVEVDLSPEDLYTHGVVKTTITARLYPLIVDSGRGSLFSDSTRIVSPAAELSAEPDVVVVLWESLRQGRIREIPSAKAEEDRFIELEGTPDLIVEIVSDSSERKDLERLPRLYAAAGVPELWLADCRTDLAFEIHTLGRAGYEQQPADPEGWSRSPLLDRSVRLVRRRNELSRWVYDLESRG
ncbi:MAG TPA: Uma2 family endonuclease [Thermoanaerobaculia bacterium]|nr:Uma2 family endonuclease [Thermoanaerobaculia bacterium]